jgi:hypothetical protein
MTPWKEGYLDIHQISTGRGNAAFMILPDGTTMVGSTLIQKDTIFGVASDYDK